MTQFDFQSLPDLAGQRLMLGFDGQTLNAELKHLIKEYRTGGIILFRANIESADQLRRLCMDARKYALDQGLPDLFVAVDQEGGQVARLRKPFTEFPGNPHMKTLEDAREFARITASELTDMGINMNMAPVMDVVPPDVDSIMKDRAFTGDANRVSQLGTAVIQGTSKRRGHGCGQTFSRYRQNSKGFPFFPARAGCGTVRFKTDRSGAF